MAKPAHIILLAPDPDGFSIGVTVVPPPQGVGHDRAFPSHDQAKAYSTLLAGATGWPVMDHCQQRGD